LTIDDCEFNGNSCIDAGGAVRLGSAGSTNTITGTTFTGNYIIGDSGDGGAIRVTGDDSTYVLTDCDFIGNTAADDGAAVRYGPDRSELTVMNCVFLGNGKDADGNVVGDDGVWSTNDDDCGPMTLMNCLFVDNACNDDRLVELKAAFALLNCTFVGNEAGDKALIAVRGRDWDSTGDEEDDVTTDDSIIANCLFINNTMLSDKRVIGDTRNDVFAPTVINCLFFGNIDENGETAANTDDNSVEVGTIDVSGVTDAAQIVVDPAGDYNIAEGSPAIDASDPDTATAADIVGMPAFGIRDVGAYESEFEPPPSYTFDGTLDDTWDHDNGSDQWDGTGPGEGNPGGAATLTEDDVDFLRIQDIGDPRDLGISEPSNRKVYLTRLTDISLDGLSIEVRMRVATTPPLDNQISGDPWPAEGIGYHIRDGGKGMIGVSDGVGVISFSLGQAGEEDYPDATSDLLVVNNLVGTEPTGDVDTGEGDLNAVAIEDAAQWNTFVIDIVAGGAGTHVVTVSANGGPAESFDVTVGDGTEAEAPYIAIGSSGTGGITAFDVDYILVK
jgi:hypothetical protein